MLIYAAGAQRKKTFVFEQMNITSIVAKCLFFLCKNNRKKAVLSRHMLVSDVLMLLHRRWKVEIIVHCAFYGKYSVRCL